jgi:hypothetical protein
VGESGSARGEDLGGLVDARLLHQEKLVVIAELGGQLVVQDPTELVFLDLLANLLKRHDRKSLLAQITWNFLKVCGN